MQISVDHCDIEGLVIDGYADRRVISGDGITTEAFVFVNVFDRRHHF